jgi:hypothetical protein
MITPLGIGDPGQRRAIGAVARQWGNGPQRYFDVQLETGRTVILCLETRSLRWYVIGTWGRAQMA